MIANYKTPLDDNLLNIIINIVVTTICSFFLGFVYSSLILLTPFIYINFFVSLFFGIITGYCFLLSRKLFPIFNKKTIIIISFVSGFTALFFAWQAHLLYLVYEEDFVSLYFKSFGVFFYPKEFFKLIIELNNVGSWTLLQIPFNGLLLSFVWILEAIIIIFSSVYFQTIQKEEPYSIILKKPYHKYLIKKDFEVQYKKGKLAIAIQENVLETIKNFKNGKAHNFARVSIYFLADEENQYISIENVRKNLGNSTKEHTYFVIKNQLITKQEALQIIDFYKPKKSFFDFFSLVN